MVDAVILSRITSRIAFYLFESIATEQHDEAFSPALQAIVQLLLTNNLSVYFSTLDLLAALELEPL